MLCICIIWQILTHLAYRTMGKKPLYIKQKFTVLKTQGKRVLSDVICNFKMMSFKALGGVMSFLRLKKVTNTCTRMRGSLIIGGNSSVQWRKVGRS